MDKNKVIIIGKLTTDPEKFPAGSTTVVEFTVAVNERYKDRKTTTFFDVKVWGRPGDNCHKWLRKGRIACVEGKLRIENYTGKDGQKRRRVYVLADDVVFGPTQGGAAPASSSGDTPADYGVGDNGDSYGAADYDSGAPVYAGESEGGQDDLPF